jgi:UDPglucose--hexose-1-phosphate uridylyltransferase
LTGDWISLSAARQSRPHLPSEQRCPLCPASSIELAEVSELPYFAEEPSQGSPPSRFAYEWASFENLYPALWQGNETGHCEVILFRRQHTGHIADMTIGEILGVIEVWQDRSKTIGAMPGIESVFLFENRGADIGVTLHHPHGQVYAFGHIPPRLRLQLDHAERYHATHMGCLVCDMAQRLDDHKELILWSGEHLIAFIPPAPRFPYELHITSRRHRTHIEQLNEAECLELAYVLKEVVAMYDRLFGFSLPYIMQHHQCPSHAKHHSSYHWNIQITPFHRSRDRLKYLAGAETGVGFFVNDSLPEEKIKELRACFEKPTIHAQPLANGRPES